MHDCIEWKSEGIIPFSKHGSSWFPSLSSENGCRSHHCLFWELCSLWNRTSQPVWAVQTGQRNTEPEGRSTVGLGMELKCIPSAQVTRTSYTVKSSPLWAGDTHAFRKQTKGVYVADVTVKHGHRLLVSLVNTLFCLVLGKSYNKH